MKRNFFSLLFLLIAAAFTLSSCSGPVGNVVCGASCNSGNANVTLTLFDAPPANASFISFNTPITAITLTPQTGADVSIFAPTTPTSFEMTRLQSDSAPIGTFQVPSGTYTRMNFFLGSTSSVFANSSSSAIGACAANTVCNLNSGTPGAISAIFTSPLIVAASANIGLGIEFNLNNAVTTQNGITIDFNQPNIITVSSLPRTGQAAGTLDTIEDFTGVITTLNGSNVTITSGTRGTLTGAVTSSTTYTALSSVNTTCNNQAADVTCLGMNKTVSVDATISTSGVVTITEVDFLDDPFTNEIEGIIYPTTTAGVYGMIVSDKVNATGNALLTPVSSGATISVTLDSAATFAIDTRNLLVSIPIGFSSAADIFAGQEVMIHVKSASVGTVLDVVTDRLVLRYSRITGTVNTVGGNAFSVNGLPPFLGSFTGTPQVQTFAGITTFDGFSSLSDLATGNPSVSFRALYLNPNTAANGAPFLAAKVRKH
jgi:hypothetical protein